MKILMKYIAFIIIYFLFNSGILSQNLMTVLQRVEIKNNKSGFMFFSSIPKDFHSDLSEDKTKIFINVFNASLNNLNLEVHSSGILQDIFSKQFGDTLKITVIAQHKTGYTLVPLPYSKTLMIELFDWKKLNKAEDNYRQGLLALENGIITPAKKSLSLASDLGNPNAAANLALLQVYDGKLKSAFKNLLFANKLKSNIPDAYACLSQIYKMFDLKEKSSFFAKKFSQMTGLKSFPEIIIGEIPPDDSLDAETIKLLEKINQPIGKVKIVKNDTLNNKFKDLLKQNINQKEKENTSWQVIKSFFPDWFFNYVLVVLAIVFLGLAILWFSYVKWKKNQLSDDEKTIIIDRNEFNEELEVAKNTNAFKSHASNLYKKNELKSKQNVTIEDNKEKTSKEIKNEKHSKPVKNSNAKKTNEDNSFENKIDKIAQQLINAQKMHSLEEYEEEIAKEAEKKKKNLDANTKLAKKLQSKKQKIKQNKLEKLTEKISKDTNKVDDLAKELKLEKRSIKTKINLKNLEKDKKSLENIKKKFNDENENNIDKD